MLTAAMWQSQLYLDIIINFDSQELTGKKKIMLFSNIIQKPCK